MTDSTSLTATQDQEQRSVLPRRLGVITIALLIVAWNAPVAAMAGFQQLAVGLGNQLGAPLSFLVAGTLLLVFALGFVSMSRHVRNPGAFYCYVTDGLGRAMGLAGAFVATAAYIVLAAGAFVYLGLIATDAATELVGSQLLPWQVWSFLAITLVLGIGLLRIDLSMKAIGILVCVEIALVAAWQAAIIVRGGPEGYSPGSFTPAAFNSGSVGLGVLFAMLCLIGFEGGACFRDEARDPDRTVRRATLIALAFMAVFYAIGCWVYIVSQGPSKVVEVATSNPIGSFYNSIETYLGPLVLKVVIVVLITSQLAANVALQGYGSRYLFALGRDGALPKRLASVHPRLESPHVAIVSFALTSYIALGAITLAQLEPVESYAALTGAGLYFLLPLLIVTSIAVIVYFRRHPEHGSNPWLTLVAPAVSALGLAVLFVLTALNLEILAVTRTGVVLAQVALVVVAVAGYLLALRYKRTKPEVYERIGHL